MEFQLCDENYMENKIEFGIEVSWEDVELMYQVLRI